MKKSAYILIAFFFSISVVAEDNVGPRVKTAFIYQFTKFIDWKTPLKSNFKICLVGSGRMLGELQELARTKKIKDRTIDVSHSPVVDDKSMTDAEIVLVDFEDSSLVEPTLQRIRSNTALVILAEGSPKNGAVIGFFVKENSTLGFEIDTKAAKDKGFLISSQLLKLAVIKEVVK